MVEQIAPKMFEVQSAIFYNEKLKYTDKIIYIFLCAMANDGKAIVSIKEIAKKCNCAKQSVHNSLNRLSKNKFITIERRHIQGMYSDGLLHLTSIYTILATDFLYTDVREVEFKKARGSGLVTLKQVEYLASPNKVKRCIKQ